MAPRNWVIAAALPVAAIGLGLGLFHEPGDEARADGSYAMPAPRGSFRFTRKESKLRPPRRS